MSFYDRASRFSTPDHRATDYNSAFYMLGGQVGVVVSCLAAMGPWFKSHQGALCGLGLKSPGRGILSK